MTHLLEQAGPAEAAGASCAAMSGPSAPRFATRSRHRSICRPGMAAAFISFGSIRTTGSMTPFGAQSRSARSPSCLALSGDGTRLYSARRD